MARRTCPRTRPCSQLGTMVSRPTPRTQRLEEGLTTAALHPQAISPTIRPPTSPSDKPQPRPRSITSNRRNTGRKDTPVPLPTLHRRSLPRTIRICTPRHTHPRRPTGRQRRLSPPSRCQARVLRGTATRHSSNSSNTEIAHSTPRVPTPRI